MDDSQPISGEHQLGPYLLSRKLGEGGMGIVWLAHDPVLKRDIAVKELRTPQAMSESAVKRFLREAQSAARLNHPNILTIYQIGRHEGQLYIAMEFVEAGSLADHLAKNGPLPWREATRAIRDAAAGLKAAHEAGIVHRDVKPSNLMRTGWGGVKVVDFGLAWADDEEGQITLAGKMVGTPAYMAPEQCRGESADARSDLYSLVCSYFTLLSGRAPFPGKNATSMIHQHLNSPFPDARQYASDLPESVALVLGRGTMKDPAQRYQSAAQLIAALDDVLADSGRGEQRVAIKSPESAEASTIVVARVPPGQPSSTPTNLRPPLTSFIGRKKELEITRKMLGESRLLTLTGIGGTGKTRLSIQVGMDSLRTFADGVFMVELAPISDGQLIAQTAAAALGIREEVGQPILSRVMGFLKTRNALLILDNCEHLIEACARLAESLLQECTHLRILATSREPLAINGEATFRVPSLSLPPASELLSVDSLRKCEAVELFVQRASASRAGFAITDENREPVARICRRLDGIPLAIELAAARVSALSVEQIASRLDDRFRLLTGGSRTALPRQKTLRALIDWSYDLLGEDERALLRRLAVFAGGCTLEAAEGICRLCDDEALDLLQLLPRLVDKSLVVMSDGPAPRYHLLETVRQYAMEKLTESGEVPAVQARHLRYYHALAEKAAAKYRGPGHEALLKEFDAEHDNFRAALDCPGAIEGDAELGLRLAACLWMFWVYRGHLREGRDRLERLLSRPGPPTPYRASALNGAAALAWMQADFEHAIPICQQSLLMAREIGDRGRQGKAMMMLGDIALYQGEYDEASRYLEQVERLAQDLGDSPAFSGAMHSLGLIAQLRSDFQTSADLLELAASIARNRGDQQGAALSQAVWGNALGHMGRHGQAQEMIEEALAMFRSAGDPQHIAVTQFLLALTLLARGNVQRASQLCAQAVAGFESIADKWGLAITLDLWAQVLSYTSDLAEAERHARRALETSRLQHDKRGIAWAMATLGRIYYLQRNDRAAIDWLHQSLRLLPAMRERRVMAHCLERLALIAADRDAKETAAKLLGAARRLRKESNCPLTPVERPAVEKLSADLEQDFAPALAAGEAMESAAAIDLALRWSI